MPSSESVKLKQKALNKSKRLQKEKERFYTNILYPGSLACEQPFDFMLHIRTDNFWNSCTWLNLKKTHYAHDDSGFPSFCSQPFYHMCDFAALTFKRNT